MALARPAYSPLPSLVLGGGLVLVFLGERLLGAGGLVKSPTSIAGLLAVVAALVLRALRARRFTGAGPDAEPERALAWLHAAALAALAGYFVTSDLWFHLTGYTLQKQAPRLAAVIETLWPALLLLSVLPTLLMELSLREMARAPVRDVARVRAARYAGMGIAFALVFSFAIAYVASERDRKADLSYFRVARAGESTLKLVETLDKPVQAFLFFPPANEVLVEVESYFDDLRRRSPQLQVQVLDQAVDPARARELGVSGNGAIVLQRDTLREQIPMPLRIESARDALRRLDEEVHKRLLGVTRPPRVAYLTQGHGERRASAAEDTDRRDTVRLVRDYLLDQGYEVKDLGLAEGLGTDVPADAAIVLVLGPQQAFLDEEAAALERYLDRQGRLLIALDPEAGITLDNLLGPLGLVFRPTVLAHDEIYWRRSHTPGDRANVIAGSFASHASVGTLSRFGASAPVIFPGAGHLELKSTTGANAPTVRFTVHSDGRTWADSNGNFEHDTQTEVRKSYELVAAVTRRNASAILPEEEGRAIVLADSDVFTDTLLRNRPNAALFVDAIRWLGGEERIAGAINTEEDVPITHTRKQDVVWFYSSVFLGPALVLLAGFLVTRRRRRPVGRGAAVARADGGAPPPAPEAPGPDREAAP